MKRFVSCVYIYNVQPVLLLIIKMELQEKPKEGEPTYGIKETKDPFDYHNKSSNKVKIMLLI